MTRNQQEVPTSDWSAVQ